MHFTKLSTKQELASSLQEVINHLNERIKRLLHLVQVVAQGLSQLMLHPIWPQNSKLQLL